MLQTGNDASHGALMACAVHVWELVFPMEMAERLANLELAHYIQVREDLCLVYISFGCG